jgi:DNA gyrase subunit A
MLVRVPARTISRIGRNTQGVRLVNLKSGDKLIAAARVMESEGGETVDVVESPSQPPEVPSE